LGGRIGGVDENPYKTPGHYSERAPRRRMRLPWLVVGTFLGILAMCLLLPMCSDLTGTIQSVVVVVCPLVGLGLGLFLDAINSAPAAPPDND
jgi:hypothetical protein